MTSRRTLAWLCTTVTTTILSSLPALADRKPQAAMFRYPDVSATHIVFVYANQLWLVPRAGGLAQPLASPPGGEAFPRFSPDGQSVAFIGNYDGNRDIYTIPTAGGTPLRATHHPATETLCDWTPDGKGLLFFAGYQDLGRQTQLFVVPAKGGLPAKQPVPYGANGAISPDGTWLAYTPHTVDARTWKRYRGGMATDIWLFNLRNQTSKKITGWEGTDSQPMWHGDRIFYICDDGPSHKMNIWSYDTRTGLREQITRFEEFDVKWPAIGPGTGGDGEIVFQNGSALYLLDLKTRQSRTVEVTVPGDRPTIRPQRVDAAQYLQDMDASPTGKRAAFGARGDIWTVPASKGSPRNLTRTADAAERSPAWSPDGRWIAYFSDQTGEYELYLRQSDGRGQPRPLTSSVAREMKNIPPGTVLEQLPACFRIAIAWSPDSKYIGFTDKAGRMYLHTLAPLPPSSAPATQPQPEKKTTHQAGDHQSPATAPADETEIKKLGVPPPGKTLLVDTEPWSNQPQASWSHDSNWIAYTRGGDNTHSAIWLYSLVTGKRTQATSGMFNDSSPAFDRKGDYLYFATQRHFGDPMYEDIGSTFVYRGTAQLAVVPLRAKVGSPWLPKSDEETWKDESKDKEKDKADKDREKKTEGKKGEDKTHDAGSKPAATTSPGDSAKTESKPATAPASKPADKTGDAKDKDKKKDKPLEIDLPGFEQRAVLLPVGTGGFSGLSVNHEGKLIYLRSESRRRGGGTAIKIFDVKDEQKEEKTVLDDVGGYSMTADGKKLLVNKGGHAFIDAAPNQKVDKRLSLEGMVAQIDPRQEWRQILLEAWRIERDYFYVPNMHGVDWPALRDRYTRLLDDCVSRDDVGFLIRELISELNVGHAYYMSGGDTGPEPSVAVGMLGADFELANNAYRIQRIIQGGTFDLDARGPLSQPGVKVKEGDYLLAVNGVPVDTGKDPWAAFLGLAGKTVTLTVSDKPTLDLNAPLATTKDDKDEEKKDDKDTKKDDQDTKKDEKKDAKDPKDDRKDEEDKPEPLTGQRDVVVTLMGGEGGLRYRAWVERHRAHVESASGGKVGYIHVPDTGVNGQNELFRQFFGQREKAALIIDERWNGGGQIPTRFIELLNRPVTNYWHRRDGQDWRWPPDSHQGPKCMLINGMAGSGGDAFPYYFRQAGLGKLIGMRTWGGLVGMSGNPGLIDGAHVTVPTFGFYKTNGTWGIEGHGVDPDIEVVDDPAKMTGDGDPQLDYAIQHMLTAIKEHPYIPPQVPADPDRRGMGVEQKDR
ncbi:MAG: PD40 domain-containing protein [Phycisphaerae bacterium]|nr:PD40 domain-containing protein [Phycisphaerae bacterium]